MARSHKLLRSSQRARESETHHRLTNEISVLAYDRRLGSCREAHLTLRSARPGPGRPPVAPSGLADRHPSTTDFHNKICHERTWPSIQPPRRRGRHPLEWQLASPHAPTGRVEDWRAGLGRSLGYWDRSRARPAVGGGFPFLLFRLQDGFTVPPWLTFPEAPL